MQLESWQRSLASALSGRRREWPAAAVAVHRANVEGARVRATGGIYPVLRQILGAGCFDALAADFVRANPSYHPDLNLSGNGFPAWLKRHIRGQPAFLELPYLPDLARLERAVNAAYYAADSRPVTPEAFTPALSRPHRYRLRLARSVHTLASPWPIAAIWRAHETGAETGAVAAGHCHAIIWRDETEVRVESLDLPDWRTLRAIAKGEPFAALPRAGLTEARLARFIESGWVVSASSRSVT